ncbi:cytochrome P450 [Nocardia sp. 2]|uniref:Cytochrome P450 n=1 Tax=Nocardia acididurans TaxID=2802282 RepID=A0ABS1M6K6_9NOCA|nr:cytochrome P450 [Nocardia acididurans]MBL1076216.1 cytochrome P450 [Nocardia acididurans]
MKPRQWIRWTMEQGMPRAMLRRRARRGDPFARLMVGSEGRENPYPVVEELRQAGRLVPTSINWVTVDYELSRSILRDNRFGAFITPDINTPGKAEMPDSLRRLLRSAILPANPVDPPSLLMLDPPDHTRVRKSVSAAFTPRAIGKLRDRVESVTTELLDALPANGTVDLIEAFAAQLPMALIAEMLGVGVDSENRERFLSWGDRVTPLLDFGVPLRTYRLAAATLAQVDAFLDNLITELRANPGDNILSSLVTANELDPDELKSTASLLFGAGFETTVNLIGNGVTQLLAHPDQLELLHAEPALWPQAVEEVLRFDSPVQSTARMALCEMEIAGVTLRPGNVVVMILAGANRDPKIFENPNAFDITRANVKEHLSFSSGPHVCLGASLARMEGAYALRTLFERFPDLRLAGTPERRLQFNLHGYAHLPVHLGRQVPAAA